MNAKKLSLPLAATMTVCIMAVPSQAQKHGRLQVVDKAAITIAPEELDVRALLPDGTRMTTGSDGGIAGLPLVSECFNGFADGPVNGQFLWTTFVATQLTPVVESVSPIEGARGVNLPDDPIAANGTNNGIFTPNVGAQPVGAYTCTAKLMIPVTTLPGAQYNVQFQAVSQGFLTNRILFFPIDIQPQANVVVDADDEPFDIIVLNDPDNAGVQPLQFYATGFEYVPGQNMDVRIEVDSPNNTQRYYINNVLVFTGTAYAGTSIENGLVYNNSFHDVGEIGKTDCIAFEPGLPAPSCDGDVNNNGVVDVDDLVTVILTWGNPDATGIVDVDDLVAVILNWGDVC